MHVAVWVSVRVRVRVKVSFWSRLGAGLKGDMRLVGGGMVMRGNILVSGQGLVRATSSAPKWKISSSNTAAQSENNFLMISFEVSSLLSRYPGAQYCSPRLIRGRRPGVRVRVRVSVRVRVRMIFG